MGFNSSLFIADLCKLHEKLMKLWLLTVIIVEVIQNWCSNPQIHKLHKNQINGFNLNSMDFKRLVDE